MSTPQEAALAAHRAFYDAIETGDVDLMTSLWADSELTTCIHPLSPPLRGTAAVLRSWTLVMANISYIQFFLTDISVQVLGASAPGTDRGAEPQAVAITCTENILSDASSAENFAGATVVATSILVRDGGAWKFWSRHASPVATEGEE